MGAEFADLRLLWPRDVFTREAQRLLGWTVAPDRGVVEFLLEEAFGEAGVRYLVDNEVRFPWKPTTDASDALSEALRPQRAARLLADLVDRVETIPLHTRKQYYRARAISASAGTVIHLVPAATRAARAFANLVSDLDDFGYFELEFGRNCSADGDTPDREGAAKISQMLGVEGEKYWPPWRRTGGGSAVILELVGEHDLLSLVEALRDLVARPSQRSWHSEPEEWHFADYTRSAGQSVYTGLVNQLFARLGYGYRIAVSGPDAGLVVQAASPERDELIDSVLEANPSGWKNVDLRAAIALFRSRDAGIASKRDAVTKLAGILEDRRQLIKEATLTEDENDLFNIANNFHLRHRNARQRANYREEFLDWVFWVYLETIELTDRLLPHSSGSVPTADPPSEPGQGV